MKEKSPAFSTFRELLDLWDGCVEKDKLADDESICFFFIHDDKVYGGTEEARLTFAMIKNPEKDDNVKDASFSAINLEKAVNGQQEEKMFAPKDAKKMKIISKEEAFKKL